jgi:hypothetical protein
MDSVTFRGQTFRLASGPATPLHLETIAPPTLPTSWAEIDAGRWSPERDYGRAYSSRHGLRVLLTASIEADKRRWLHLSVSHRGGRLPQWREMCQVKDLFCGLERTAYQVHPPQDKHISIQQACLHLWCPLDGPVTPDFTRGGQTI